MDIRKTVQGVFQLKTFDGIAKNFSGSILGVLTKKENFFFRSKKILIVDKLSEVPKGYAGIITIDKLEDFKSKTPIISNLKSEDFSELKSGDLVNIESSGKINVVWETESSHNSILVTEQCNAKCVMCPQPPKKDSTDLFEFNLKILNLLDSKKVDHLGITGGEPTIIGEKLFEIIAVCQKRFPRAALTLLSNGIKFKDFEFAKRLALLNHKNLLICVPLYADTDQEHNKIMGRSGCFYDTLKGIQNLAILNQKIEIRIVIHKLNYKRLKNTAEFIYSNFPFVAHIAFMGMECTGLAKKNLNALWIDPHEYMSELTSAVLYLHKRAMRVSIYNLQLCIMPKTLWQFSRSSISTWKRKFLDICTGCELLEKCGGVFLTSGESQSKFIHKFVNNA